MKKHFVFKGNLFILLLCFTGSLFSQSSHEVNAWFIGSHGFLLESATEKIALDAIIYWEGSNYGYIKPPLAVKDKIEAAKPPFDSLDLILISHAHSDHFNSAMVEESMSKNPKAVLVTTPEVYTTLVSQASGISAFSDRIWAPHLDFYTSKDTTIGKIPLTITNIPHSGTMDLFVFAFTIDSTRFLQMNSWNSITASMYDTLGFNRQRADVALLCYDYILNSSKFTLFKNYLNPRFSAICHIDGASSARINQIQSKIELNQADYPMSMLTIPMEGFTFKINNDTLMVDTLNTAPKMGTSIKDTAISTDLPFSLPIPVESYYDQEGGPLTISFTLSNGDPLPDWLSFNETTNCLEGTPETLMNYDIKITVSDTNQAMRSDIFRIVVEISDELTSISMENIKIYPLWVKDKVTVDIQSLENQPAKVSLVDLRGCLLRTYTGEDKIMLDLSDLNPGVFLIRVETGRGASCNRIIKQ